MKMSIDLNSQFGREYYRLGNLVYDLLFERYQGNLQVIQTVEQTKAKTLNPLKRWRLSQAKKDLINSSQSLVGRMNAIIAESEGVSLQT